MQRRQQEFAEFYITTRDTALRAVLGVVGDRHQAEDAVAEAYARAWARWRQVREYDAPKAWVVKVALNVRISWWRRLRREVTLPEEYDVDNPDHDSLAVELSVVLCEGLRRLSRRQREVIALRVFCDLDIEATAQVLGIAAGTVSAHMARALSTLRAQCAQFTPEEIRK